MTFDHLKKHAKEYRPILVLDNIVSHKNRKIFEKTFLYIAVISLFLSLEYFEVNTEKMLGAALLSASLWAVFFMIESFYYSYYFSSEEDILGRKKGKCVPITYELAKLVINADQKHITQSFLESDIGKEIVYRLELNDSDIDRFFKSRQSPVNSTILNFEDDITSISGFSKAVLSVDKEFEEFLMKNRINKKDFIGASKWVELIHQRKKEEERWWSVDKMSRIKGIAKDWAYGNTYTLDKYSRDLSFSTISMPKEARNSLYRDYVRNLEAILSRSYEANALIIGEEGTAKLEIVSALAEKIESGDILSPLEHKKIIMLDTDLLTADNGDKNTLERAIIKIFNEAVKAGNIILYIDDLPSFIASAKAVEVDFISLVEDYISSRSIQLIAESTNGGYNRILQKDEKIEKRFETIKISSSAQKDILIYLEDEIVKIEKQTGLFFTYQTIRAIVDTAEKYFVSGVLEEKVTDFMSEIVPRMIQNKRRIVRSSDVYDMIKEKTGVPVGEVKEEEKQKLINLEEILSQRVIGQKEAIFSISDAMRRNRSGISREDRPIGSFLFLGPTGVGKTETSKALAEAIFGDEKKMLRLDMSEFNTPDSLNRLIGGGNNNEGILSTLIRENQYGVLLLDEFEKTDESVQNLFLQILDEGIFSDVTGKKVNARNIIFIATSNAGSDLIWNAMKENVNLSHKKDEIIDKIINRGSFKPELVNRFDGTILFHPLTDNELREISKLMLEKLKKRLASKNIDFVIDENTILMLVELGRDPQFGARPLNRAIQNNIESDIAKKIMSGELRPGMKYKFEVNEK